MLRETQEWSRERRRQVGVHKKVAPGQVLRFSDGKTYLVLRNGAYVKCVVKGADGHGPDRTPGSDSASRTRTRTRDEDEAESELRSTADLEITT